jgi:hypothetical protein
MLSKKFKNEIGNPITIKVKNRPGVAEGIKYTGVSLSIIGPTSMSEWCITDVEARQLYDLLGKFIRKNNL